MNDTEYDELFYMGIAQLQQMYWADAEVTFQACTQARPDQSPAWGNLTIAYFRQGKTDLALEAGSRSVELDPKSGSAWLSLAGAQLDAGLFREAAQSAEQAATLQAGGSAPLGMAAHAYEALGDYEAALKAARKAKQAEPAYDPLVRVIAADALRMLERDRAALREYKEIITNEQRPGLTILGEPPVARAYRGKGLLHYKFGRLRRQRAELVKAVDSFEKAIDRDATEPRNWAGLAMAKRDLYQFSDALFAVDKAIALSTKDGFLALERSLALFELGRYEEAVNDFDEALSDVSLDASLRTKAFEFRAVSYLAGRQNDSCIAACNEAIEIGVKSAIVLNALAMAHFFMGDTETSETVIREARILSPDDPVVIANEASIAFARGDAEEADELSQLALAKGSRSPEVLIGRFSFLVRTNRPEEAKSFFKSAQERLRDWPEVLEYFNSRANEAGLEGSLHAAGERIAQLERELAFSPSRTRPPSAIFDTRIAQLEDLLNRTGVKEEEIKQFLKDERSRFMFGAQAVRTHTEHKLGSDFGCDFVLEYPERRYLLVEIENPKHLLFTKKGDKRSELVHACQQVEDWQQWIDENNSYAQTKLPGCVTPQGLIIIGRSAGLNEKDQRRLQRANISFSGRLRIITYDGILLEAKAVAESIRRAEAPDSPENPTED